MSMKKTLLSTAVAAICCLAANAQYVADPATNTQVNPTTGNYGNEAVVNASGVLYSKTLIPDSENEQQGETNIASVIQVLDKDGRKVLPGDGEELWHTRNRSYTMVNQTIYADNDGNCIMISSDCRNAEPTTTNLGYTVYKIGPDGKQLWSADLADGTAFESVAMLKVVQTSDGGYVFAYAVFTNDNSFPMYIRMEKLTADGQKAWQEPVLLQDSRTSYAYPYIVDAGDNQVMLIYARGSSQYIEAQLYDFDGTPLWAEPLTVYQGGFASDIPLHTKLNVVKAPEGAFVAWSDDRSYEGSYANYVSYVKRDGTLAFPGGINGLKISYADSYSRQVPQLYYCDADQSLYAIYRQYNQRYQALCGIYMQRISADGELMWGPEGKDIVAMQQQRAVGYATVQGAGGTDVAVFYQTNSQSGGDTKTYARRMDCDGNDAWQSPLEVSTVTSEKSDLQSSQLIDGSYWILTWLDQRESADRMHDGLFAQRVNTDGTLGSTTAGISRTETDKAPESVDVYTLDGRTVMTGAPASKAEGLGKGIYVVKDKATGKARKIAVK